MSTSLRLIAIVTLAAVCSAGQARWIREIVSDAGRDGLIDGGEGVDPAVLRKVVVIEADAGTENGVWRRARSVCDAETRRKGFAGQILVVTAGASDQEAIQLIEAGVAGILHKHHSTEMLCKTIRQVAKGEVCLEKNYLASLFRSVDRSHPLTGPKLTERDKTVLRFILQGLANREIAARLEVSEGAVKASLRQVFSKLGVRTRSQVVKVALEQYRDQL